MAGERVVYDFSGPAPEGATDGTMELLGDYADQPGTVQLRPWWNEQKRRRAAGLPRQTRAEFLAVGEGR